MVNRKLRACPFRPEAFQSRILRQEPARSCLVWADGGIRLEAWGTFAEISGTAAAALLVAGQDTAGKYTLIDMHVPPGGGPPPHRHDFEEMFTVLTGEVRVTFRGQTITAQAGQTINVPANAPHSFINASGTPSRLLCMCAPAGQEEFFTLVGQPVATRTEAPPPLSPDAQAAFIARSRSLAPQFKTELLPPGSD
jgi:quercetin dioxygenase-like cupin family protein